MESVERMIDYYDLKGGMIKKNDPVMIKLMKKSVAAYDKMGAMVIKGEDVFADLIMMEMELDQRLERKYRCAKRSGSEPIDDENVSVFSESGLHIKDQYKELLRAFIKRVERLQRVSDNYLMLRERIHYLIQTMSDDIDTEPPPKLKLYRNDTTKMNESFIERNKHIYFKNI
jgi:hypothetical protein